MALPPSSCWESIHSRPEVLDDLIREAVQNIPSVLLSVRCCHQAALVFWDWQFPLLCCCRMEFAVMKDTPGHIPLSTGCIHGMVNVKCDLNEIWIHLGCRPQGMIEGDYLDWVNDF